MQQIIHGTPLYVWAILAFLIQRGVMASRERELSLQKLCIIPLVMTGLSLQGIHASFGFGGVAPLAWLAGALLGGALGWRLIKPAAIVADTARASIRQAGSWLPLVLMLSIFCMKYAVAVALAITPALRQELGFVATAAALYGIFSGIFTGRLLRSLALYRQADQGGPANRLTQAAQ